MNIPNDLPGEITLPEGLKGVYFTHVFNGNSAGRDGQLPKDLAVSIDSIVETISNRLKDGSYRFTSYLEVLKVKSASKLPRVISIPTARDRIVLRMLSNYLSEHCDVHREAPQEIIGRIREEFINPASQFDAFIKMDIKNFYPTIRHDKLRQILGEKIESTGLIDLILKACGTATVPKFSPRPDGLALEGVPQGLSISNVLAEIFLGDFDKGMRYRSDIMYFRYVDDILIFCRSQDISQLEDQIRRHLISVYGIVPHARNSNDGKSIIGILGSDEVQYLGYIFGQDRNGRRLVSVRKSSRHKHENSIVKVFTDYKYRIAKFADASDPEEWQDLAARRCEWWLNFVITGCIFDNERRGWVQYFSKTTDFAMLNSLDNLIRKLMRDYALQDVITPKNHRQAHRSINHRNKRRKSYIPNFDEISVGEKLEILLDYFGMNSKFLMKRTSEEIEAIFHKRMQRKIAELDRDIGALS